MNQKLQYFQFNMDINETKTKKRGGKRPNSGRKKINVERVRISLETKKRGGKRPNSGRKKINVERVRISFIVIKDKAEMLKKQIKNLIQNENNNRE